MKPRAHCLELANSLVKGKTGLEIGGPSTAFRERPLPIYCSVGQLDNCDFSAQTAWADHANQFVFDTEKQPGKSIFCDGSYLTVVPDNAYDFVLSCHNLEHFANPVKALKEWQRVTKPGASLILVLPYYKDTFDHHRTPTPVSHMLEDYEKGTTEEDLTHLNEILEKHDLSRDPRAGDFENFRKRSLANFENRCLHHHVFDTGNVRELLTSLGMNVLAVETAPTNHLLALAKMN